MIEVKEPAHLAEHRISWFVYFRRLRDLKVIAEKLELGEIDYKGVVSRIRQKRPRPYKAPRRRRRRRHRKRGDPIFTVSVNQVAVLDVNFGNTDFDEGYNLLVTSLACPAGGWSADKVRQVLSTYHSWLEEEV